MRRRVEDLQVEIPTPDGPMTVSGLTVSIGGAVHSRPGEDLRTLLHIADTALYSAKRAGRNRVRMGLSAAQAFRRSTWPASRRPVARDRRRSARVID